MEPGIVRLEATFVLEPRAAWDAFLDELAWALRRRGLVFEAGEGGRLIDGDSEIGRVVEWSPPERLVLRWSAAPWDEAAGPTLVEVRCGRVDGGSRLVLEQRGCDHATGDASQSLGWFASAVAAPLLEAMSPRALGDWITDRLARRPSGAQSRATYRDPLFHYPGFLAMLLELRPGPDDHVLDIGCGGGALLQRMLATGCRAAGIDHSPEMLDTARELNADAVGEGRLELCEARADRLPFDDDTFTAATMAGIVGFLPDPVVALAEARRVLRPGGRLMVQAMEESLRGTPAAPEPMASRMRWDSPGQLEAHARAAGFAETRVQLVEVEAYAREVGIPEEAMGLFTGEGMPFVVARK